MASAAELKALLMEGLASPQKIEVDLERAGEIDLTVLQLLWAAHQAGAGRADGESRGFVCRAPEALATLARQAGFESFPGQAVEIQAVDTLAAETLAAETLASDTPAAETLASDAQTGETNQAGPAADAGDR
jgi:hypothetical protein